MRAMQTRSLRLIRSTSIGRDDVITSEHTGEGVQDDGGDVEISLVTRIKHAEESERQ